MLLVLIRGGWHIPYEMPTTNIFGMIYVENLGLVSQLGTSLVVTQLHWYMHLSDYATTFFQLKEIGFHNINFEYMCKAENFMYKTKNECPL